MGEMSKIEEVARAVFDAMDIADGLDGTVARKYAVAAIEAMRKPDNDMLRASFEAMFVDKWDGTQAAMMGTGWEAGIDAALKE